MALRVSSSLGPLQTQYFVRVSCRRMCAFLLGMFLESGLLGLRADTCIAFYSCIVDLFCEVVVIVHTVPRKGEGPMCSVSLLALGVFSLSGFSLLQDVKWCLIWISLVTELSIFSPVYWLLFFRQASVQVFGLLFVVDLGEFFIHSG